MSRLATVLRVAELTEAAARARLARASADVTLAVEVEVDRRGALALLAGPAGLRPAVERTVQRREAHAGAVVEAGALLEQAHAAREGCLAQWQATARRREGMAGLVAKHAESARLDREHRDQLLADDLSAARMSRRSS
ncbi:MAG: hypothetical protein H7269_12875 [Cellulomonas sp.]|nr:hypothetical protein [Cellulomonas sp.]